MTVDHLLGPLLQFLGTGVAAVEPDTLEILFENACFTGWFKPDGAGALRLPDRVRGMDPLRLREQVERAHASESYVARHPHRGCVATAFGEMGSLAREYGFGVTVVVAPSAVRVYAPHVDDLEAPLADPHLIHALLAHARDAGFATVDLLDAFAPHAAGDPRELLYFRDDDHWSPRGHAVVAGILAGHLAGADARQPPSPDQQLRAAELRG